MENFICSIRVLGIGMMVTIVVFLSMGMGGCGKKEPPLSKEALSLKKEIKERIKKYAPMFLDPLSRGDKALTEPNR